MNLLWHLLKKDLRRLRLPLALFSLIVAGKIIFYAAISGFEGAPDIEWLRRIQGGAELILRGLAEPVMAYLLVAWMVFEDSPVEKDAHWITRPISGGQLFSAKLVGAVLAFVLWPLALNLPWWGACGFSGADLANSAAQFALVNFLLVGVALAAASLTDGFARLILWSLVGIGAFMMLQMIFASLANISPGILASRLTVSGLTGAVLAVVVAAHQFITRRHRRSLALLVAGIVLTGALGAIWRWDFLGGGARLADESPASMGLSVQLTGPVQTKQMGAGLYAQVPMQIGQVPEGAAVAHVGFAGDWSFAGKQAWFSRTGFSNAALWDGPMRQLLGLPPVPPAEPLKASLPFSPAMAQRVAHEPATLRATVELELFHGRVVAELPLRETTGPAGARAYSISHLSTGPLNDRRGNAAAAASASKSPQQVVSLLFTERTASSTGRNTGTLNLVILYKLINRRSGENFAPDPTRSGPEALAIMDQASVFCRRMTFLVGATPLRLEDWTLAIVRFDRGELLRRELKLEPVPFAGEDGSILSAPRAGIALPRATLAAYVGIYELPTGRRITITLNDAGDQLSGELAGQPKASLLAETETIFFVRGVDARVEFVKDASGTVAQLVVPQPAGDLVGRRVP